MMTFPESAIAWLLLLGRIGLAGVFLVSGVHKAVWYRKAQAEFEQAGVPLVGVMLPLTIGLHLVAPTLLIIDRFTSTAALALAVFTVIATVRVHGFWRMQGAERLARSRVFMANMAVAGGLLILAASSQGRLS